METELHLAAGYCAATGVYRSGHHPQFAAAATALSFPEYIFPRMLLPGRRARPAYVDASTGAALSFADLRALSLRVARALAAAGLRRGHVALLLSPNSLHFPALSLAVLSLGAVLSAVNPLLTPDELARQADDAKPFLVLVTGDLAPKLCSIPPNVKRVLIEQLLADIAAEVDDDHGETLDLPAANIGRDDAALLFYSSGTTGRSKGVVSTHGNAIAMAASLERAWGGGGEKPQYDDEVYGCVLPMFHMFGFSSFVMGTAALGATTVVVPGRFSVEKTMAAVEEYGVTRLLVVPPMVVKMVRAAAGESSSTSSRRRRLRLRQVVSSGAPLQREHMARFRSCFPAVKLGQCYGLTETTGIVTMCDLQHNDNNVDRVEVRLSSTEVKDDAAAATTTEAKNRSTGGGGVSIGRLMPDVEAKIVDPNSGEPLPPHHTGELWVRGPSTMRGYLDNEEATTMALVAAVVSGSGGGGRRRWLRTGDMCYVDSRGLVYVVDRVKEMIKCNAYQVAPTELEDVLVTHPDVHDAAVAPYPDKEAGEIPMAYVVKKQGSGHLQEDEVSSFVQNKVAPYKKIRKVVFVDSIPRSPSGKILRRQLKNLLQGSILHRSRM
uniref:4-coumarate--CoA ligase n=1 Tax=Oryza punctata TaxID=4537 RepID=A0A0E0LNW6_ORYPU